MLPQHKDAIKIRLLAATVYNVLLYLHCMYMYQS